MFEMWQKQQTFSWKEVEGSDSSKCRVSNINKWKPVGNQGAGEMAACLQVFISFTVMILHKKGLVLQEITYSWKKWSCWPENTKERMRELSVSLIALHNNTKPLTQLKFRQIPPKCFPLTPANWKVYFLLLWNSHLFFLSTFIFPLQKGKVSQTKIRVISTLLFILFGCLIFVALPAVIFKHIEGWSTLESIYFVVITLSTIGFGDFVAGEKGHLIFICIYGLSLVFIGDSQNQCIYIQLILQPV